MQTDLMSLNGGNQGEGNRRELLKRQKKILEQQVLVNAKKLNAELANRRREGERLRANRGKVEEEMEGKGREIGDKREEFERMRKKQGAVKGDMAKIEEVESGKREEIEGVEEEAQFEQYKEENPNSKQNTKQTLSPKNDTSKKGSHHTTIEVNAEKVQ